MKTARGEWPRIDFEPVKDGTSTGDGFELGFERDAHGDIRGALELIARPHARGNLEATSRNGADNQVEGRFTRSSFPTKSPAV